MDGRRRRTTIVLVALAAALGLIAVVLVLEQSPPVSAPLPAPVQDAGIEPSTLPATERVIERADDVPPVAVEPEPSDVPAQLAPRQPDVPPAIEPGPLWWFTERASASLPGMAPIPGGRVRVGISVERARALAADKRSSLEELAAETPPLEVDVEPFLIDATEVTNAQWQVYLESVVRAPSDDLVTYSWTGGAIPPGREDCPITNVNIEEITDYLAWSGQRLPTEAEWTRAARGDDERDYPWGETWNSERARFVASIAQGSVAVGSYPEGASPFGVLDMSGNVWEWVDTLFVAHEGFEPIESLLSGTGVPQLVTPRFDASQRVIKGGCFVSPRQDLRIDRRLGLDPRANDAGLGFRCARSATEAHLLLARRLDALAVSDGARRTLLLAGEPFCRERQLVEEDPLVGRLVTGFEFLLLAPMDAVAWPRPPAPDERATVGLLSSSLPLETPAVPAGDWWLVFRPGEAEMIVDRARPEGWQTTGDALLVTDAEGGLRAALPVTHVVERELRPMDVLTDGRQYSIAFSLRSAPQVWRRLSLTIGLAESAFGEVERRR